MISADRSGLKLLEVRPPVERSRPDDVRTISSISGQFAVTCMVKNVAGLESRSDDARSMLPSELACGLG